MSLLEFNPIGFALVLNSSKGIFGRRTEEMMVGEMHTLCFLPYTNSFAKLGIGGEPITGLGKPPFCFPRCLSVSVVSNLIPRWVVAPVPAWILRKRRHRLTAAAT